MNSSSINTNTNTADNTIDIPSSDILSLLQSHLSECGLQSTSSTLKAESNGIGLSGLFPNSKSQLLAAATSGNWGTVLSILDTLDLDRYRKSYLDDLNHHNNNSGNNTANNNNNDTSSTIISPLERVSALCHEMTILELAEVNEIDLAYATLRMSSELIDKCLSLNDDDIEDDKQQHSASSSEIVGMISSRSGDIERRITALSSLRRSSTSTTNSSQSIPPNYYSSTNNITKQKRRDYITKQLKKIVPEIPYKRLTTLLGQSIKYQCYTGLFPTVERLFKSEEEEEDVDIDDKAEGDKKKKKKKKRKPAAEQKFDLVLGNVDISTSSSSSKKKHKKDGSTANTSSSSERIPSRVYQSIRLGKKSYIESATFLNDGKGLVTGSSDGFIEVWGETKQPSSTKDNNLNSLLPTEINYEKLRTSDLSYQATDDLMMHSTSILSMSTSNDSTLLGSTSSDGTVCIWKISDGKLLRKIQRAHGGIDGSDKGAAVTCIQFSPDGSKVLTGGHDSTCREFGLMSSRMLKEFRGHTSYVNCCSYVMIPYSVLGVGSDGDNDDVKLQGNNSLLAVVTASADGSVRVWNGRTAEPIHLINPPISTSTSNIAATSIQDKDSIVSSKSIHSVIHLHTPANTMIVVPRCDCAYLMSYSGTVLRTYTRDDVQGTEFLAANVSPSNDHLYVAASDGKCVVFDISSGNVDKIIRSFGEECSTGREGGDDDDKVCEISGIVCHPHGGYIGGYSNDKSQKRGILTLWK